MVVRISYARLRWRLCLLTLICFSALRKVTAFAGCVAKHVTILPKSTRFLMASDRHDDSDGGSSDDDDDDEDWNAASVTSGLDGGGSGGGGGELNSPERSKMPGFIQSFLNKERVKRGDAPKNPVYTHMIGVPMSECHELMIQLESVQRAVLYHCPPLIHACIVPSNSRMPLLYVDASDSPQAQVTMDLYEMTQKVVKKHCFVKEKGNNENGNTDSDLNDHDDSFAFNGLNKDGHRPLTLSFHKLEIDGKNNDVLHTVVKPGQEGQLKKLQTMVNELKALIHEQGWTTSLPPNDSQSVDATSLKKEFGFLPRIPFMRLPENFEDKCLDELPEGVTWRAAEEGGNGISPILWGKWMDDTFATHVRLREIGIYPRQPGSPLGAPLDESTYYIPHEVVALPEGNEKLAAEEARHQKYNEERYEEAEKRLPKEDKDASELREEDEDFFDPTLEENRKILETLYEKSATDWPADTDEILSTKAKETKKTESNVTSTPSASDTGKKKVEPLPEDYNVEFIQDELCEDDDDDDEVVKEGLVTQSRSDENEDMLDDWMKTRIRNIVENRESVNARKPKPKPKDLPPIEDNPVFKAYKEGKLQVQQQQRQEEEDKTQASQKELPDYPSREHLVGFWKVLRSPTGIPLEINDESTTDNFVLRVDGLVSGGPILNEETRARAGGGSWKMSILKNNDDDDDDQVVKVQIRLVIPPKRERILVMDGTVSDSLLLSFGMSELSSPGTLDFTSIVTDQNDSTTDENGSELYCSGQAWIEDAVTKRNRQEIGSFALQKIHASRDRRRYTITIPQPVRNQD